MVPYNQKQGRPTNHNKERVNNMARYNDKMVTRFNGREVSFGEYNHACLAGSYRSLAIAFKLMKYYSKLQDWQMLQLYANEYANAKKWRDYWREESNKYDRTR